MLEMPYKDQGQGQVRSTKVIINNFFNGVCPAHVLWAIFIEYSGESQEVIQVNVRSRSGPGQVKIDQNLVLEFQSKIGVCFSFSSCKLSKAP